MLIGHGSAKAKRDNKDNRKLLKQEYKRQRKEESKNVKRQKSQSELWKLINVLYHLVTPLFTKEI